MKTKRIPASVSLLVGDLIVFYGALWLALAARALAIPSGAYYLEHAAPFSIVALAWLASLYVMGVYETDTGSPRARVPSAVLSAAGVGVVASIILFYVVPFFSIAPKTILLLHVVFVAVLLWAWRMRVQPRLSRRDRVPALVIGGGDEYRELLSALSSHESFHPLRAVDSFDLGASDASELDDYVRGALNQVPNLVLVVDVAHPKLATALASLYDRSFSGARVVDLRAAYEAEFGKVPVSSVDHGWLLSYASGAPALAYDAAKRVMDVVVATAALIVATPFLVVAAVAIKLEDRGPVFIKQERVGRFGVPFVIRKLRTMTSSENGAWVGETTNRVTRVGSFLRKSSIDELPQLWSVIVGRMSLIGPRPDMTGLEERLSAEIPYYRARYLVKPGLSGWAQVRQRVVPQTLEQSRERLAFDLYYVRHRSIILDASIVVRTARALVRRLVG